LIVVGVAVALIVVASPSVVAALIVVAVAVALIVVASPSLSLLP
jgi:hypothetical protein